MVNPPAQKEVLPVIVGVGTDLKEVVVVAVPVHPAVLVTVTVQAPAVLTEMLRVVAPVFQR